MTTTTCTADEKLEYFASADTCLMWSLTELIALLSDDLNARFNMVQDSVIITGDLATIQELTAKINDITVLRDSNLPPRETTPLTNALCEGRR